jgi:hypothetical protein
MAGCSDNMTQSCGCNPFPLPVEGETCHPCSPNMTVTCAEISILGKMREIKGQVRDLSARLKEIHHTLEKSRSGDDSFQPTAEWGELTCELDGLRSQWKEWEHKLQDAIETKLIALGHREPHA